MSAARVIPIPVPTPFRVGPVNCYLIEADRLTLVDTGPNDRDAWDGLEAGLRALGHWIEDLDLILLTHQHYDHFGLAAALKERSGAEIAAHALLATLLADYELAFDADDAFAQAVMAVHGIDRRTSETLAARSKAYRRLGARIEVDRPLQDGDMLDLGDVRLRVLHRPGHSPTDTLFVDHEGEFAFVGDHLIAHISSNPVLHVPVKGRADPRNPPRRLAAYLDSLRATAGLCLRKVLPGHGEAVLDHRALALARIRGHERRKEQIFGQLCVEPRTAVEVADVLWPNLPVEQAYLALSEVRGHIDLLIAENRVSVVEKGGVLRFVALEGVDESEEGARP